MEDEEIYKTNKNVRRISSAKETRQVVHGKENPTELRMSITGLSFCSAMKS
jgi:hypothetical protein